MQSGWDDVPFRFWIPAFKVRPRLFLRLASHLTVSQPREELIPELPANRIHPCTLPVKEAIESLEPFAKEPITLYVQREYYIAEYYASDEIIVKDLQSKDKTVEPGDFILWNSRANPSLQRYRDPKQVVLRVERDGALFCVTQRQ